MKRQIDSKPASFHCNVRYKLSHTLSDEQRVEMITFYNNKSCDTDFTHICELLNCIDSINVFPSTSHRTLYIEYILSPKFTRNNI